MTSPTPVPRLLQTITADPGRPRLTWYGAGGERVELSGHVLDNWVTKSANLLVEEYDAGPGTVVAVDLPPHWRAVVWALAAWRTGACVLLPGHRPEDEVAPGASGPAPGVVVTSRPQAWPDARDVVAVALPALARRFDGELPRGATDAAAAVMTYGDVLTFMPEPDGGAPALAAAGRTVDHGDLAAWAGGGRTARVLLELGPGTAPEALVREATATLLADGSLVVTAPEVTGELAADPTRRARLVEGERVDVGA